jgi:chloramphenicol 3-O phosphotransferase
VAVTLSAAHDLVISPDGDRPGRVIILNGASSSGKSSIAEELLRTLDGPWFHLGVDMFHRIRSGRDWTDEEFLPVFQRTLLGFHRAVAGMAAAGNDVVVDHVLGERWRLADCLNVLKDTPVWFVGIQCSLPELERRERERGDRTVGRAALQFPFVHEHGIYDLETDSEHHTPAECAAEIQTRLDSGPGTAFARLRRSDTVPG